MAQNNDSFPSDRHVVVDIFSDIIRSDIETQELCTRVFYNCMLIIENIRLFRAAEVSSQNEDDFVKRCPQRMMYLIFIGKVTAVNFKC